MKSKEHLCLAAAGVLGVLIMAPSSATAQNNTSETVTTAGQTATQVTNTAGATAGGVAGQVPGTVSAVGNTAGNVVGGLQPTLQPVGQGVGSALNNLTQPDNVSALLEFLSSIVPNHIEAHVNLDALRVERLNVDVRGVDLRNLKVDLLVANSRNAGAVRPALRPTTGGASGTNAAAGSVSATGAATSNVAPGSATFPYVAPNNQEAAR